jgi:hypothetical protein
MKTPSFPIERLHFVVAVVDFRWLIRRSAIVKEFKASRFCMRWDEKKLIKGRYPFLRSKARAKQGKILLVKLTPGIPLEIHVCTVYYFRREKQGYIYGWQWSHE